MKWLTRGRRELAGDLAVAPSLNGPVDLLVQPRDRHVKHVRLREIATAAKSSVIIVIPENAMSYAGLQGVYSPTEGHLGGNVREGDPFTFSPKVWQYVVDRFAIQTILDLGSGLGYSAQYFHNLGKKVIAVDGLKENIEQAIFPTIRFDLANGPVHCSVDLTHCQEVVEHIDAKYLDNLLQSMACGKFILISASNANSLRRIPSA